jgi:hypothetical protein
MAGSNFDYNSGRLNGSQADEFAATGAVISVNPQTQKNELVILGNDTPERGPKGAVNPAYVYISPDGVNFDVSTDLDKVLNLYYNDFNKDPAYKSAVFNNLKIKKNATPTDITNALNKRIVEFGIDVATQLKSNPNLTTFTSLNKWAGGAGGSTTTVDRALSTKSQSAQELDDFFVEQLGRKATDAEKKDFYTRLRKEEQTAGVTTTTGDTTRTSVGRGLRTVDRQRIMGDVLRPAADLMSGDDLVKSGGMLGTYISKLQATARNYGLTYSPDMAKKNILNNYQAGGTLTTGSLDAEELAIKSMAKTMYPNLGKLIDSGVKVSSLADQYAYYMGQTLELPDNSIDITRDTHIQNALKNGGSDGSMNLNDFQLSLRKDPRWAKTKNAKEEASGYVNTILSSFGLVR